MGLALLFPLLLILNLQMPPGLAGLALIPTTLPMIVVAPLAGRWYDRAGGRWPLVTGFAILLSSGVLLALGVQANSYYRILPGLLVFGLGLAVTLTVNDPVTLDTIPASGQRPGLRCLGHRRAVRRGHRDRRALPALPHDLREHPHRHHLQQPAARCHAPPAAPAQERPAGRGANRAPRQQLPPRRA